MKKPTPTPPQWIDVRLGEDFNWWLQHTSAETGDEPEPRGVLDPRQVAHLAQVLEEYQPHGLRRDHLRAAFQMFEVESELAEGRLRLAACGLEFGDTDGELFALPVLGEGESEGPFHQLLDALSAARIRRLNATHHYAQPCTTDDMDEELEALDSDRYFNAATIHAFDELNEILEWSPAEWDEP
jgi:hypothetical protein